MIAGDAACEPRCPNAIAVMTMVAIVEYAGIHHG